MIIALSLHIAFGLFKFVQKSSRASSADILDSYLRTGTTTQNRYSCSSVPCMYLEGNIIQRSEFHLRVLLCGYEVVFPFRLCIHSRISYERPSTLCLNPCRLSLLLRQTTQSSVPHTLSQMRFRTKWRCKVLGGISTIATKFSRTVFKHLLMVALTKKKIKKVLQRM